MTAKELRQAADIVLDQVNFGFAVSEHRASILAEHILATVRDDDDAPLDFAFLHSVETKYFGEALMCSFEFGCLEMWVVNDEYDPLDATWSFSGANLQLTIKTRGQFRSLCRGLGIVLEEKTC